MALVETATISYRVADFLKKHPPFHSVADEDLLALAARGRVRFYEPNEYLLWQGEPHRPQVFVIQQGTVSLWDESSTLAELRDVRGAGDMLGIERFNDVHACLYSARSESDVVVYAFPSEDLEELFSKYPRAREYVNAEGRVTVDYHATGERRDLSGVFLQQLVAHKTLVRCDTRDSIRDAARRMITAGADALAVVDAEHRARAILTATDFVEWVAQGGGSADEPVERLVDAAPVVLGANATVPEGVLAMSRADAQALAITHDGTAHGRVSAVVSSRDLGAVFGEQPVTLLHEIRGAADTQALRDLNHRARAFTLQYLTSAASVDWLAQFTQLTDASILRRIVAMAGGGQLAACWCFAGSSGRAESLTRLAPQIVLVLDNGQARGPALDAYNRVIASLPECDYIPRLNLPFTSSFYVATLDEWKDRYRRWVSEPVREEMYRSRTLFDLRPIHGRSSLWEEIGTTVTERVDTDFLHVIANDCLASLPPLTFFQDAVVDKSGEQTAIFHLEESALRPLVDVGRVFGMAAGTVFGHSTIERLATTRTLLPDQQELFREAADTFRVVLWQQGRIGISEGTSGIDLPPALLSRHDRQILKGGFRSILRLLQFTANPAWIATR
ncbi:MAG: putative nucleotidyltransferase substrate binding domain-containing protein [Vicinamibacterales bacterium]